VYTLFLCHFYVFKVLAIQPYFHDFGLTKMNEHIIINVNLYLIL